MAAAGAAATAIAVVIGALAAAALARRDAGRIVRGFDALLMLPLGVSAVTVGFGFLITLDEPPLDLRTSWILVPLAQALVGVPFVVRTMLPVLRAVDERLREAAAVLEGCGCRQAAAGLGEAAALAEEAQSRSSLDGVRRLLDRAGFSLRLAQERLERQGCS